MVFRRIFVTLSILVIVFSIAGWIAWEKYGDAVIEAAYNGRSISFVNTYVAIHRSIDPADRTLDYFLLNGMPVIPRLCGMMLLLSIVALVSVRYGRSKIRRFFSEATSPLNLAAFRIVLFSTLLIYADLPLIIKYSGFPRELVVAPPGLGWILSFLPISPAWSGIAAGIFALACVGALLGYRTRLSAGIAAVIGIYVLGIPQFFGKIDHYHHLLWFAAVVAASPSGRVLSIDSLIAKQRSPGMTSPERSTQYLLPLRFVMLLMGVIYFFAGFWKFVIGGVGWGTGETMRDILYAQWFRLDWIPALRIDQYPVLCSLSGVAVLIFELGFLFALFFPRVRSFAAIGGIVFHLSVYFFAHINFWNLAVCYIVFVDLEPLFGKFAGRTISGEKEASRPEIFSARTPAFIVGIILVAVNVLCGFLLIDSWPFAVYPTFAAVEEKYLQTLAISVTNPDSSTTEVDPYRDRALQNAFHPSRLIGLCTQVLWERDSLKATNRAKSLLALFSDADTTIRKAASVRLYRDVCTVVPGESKRNPVRRELLLRLP